MFRVIGVALFLLVFFIFSIPAYGAELIIGKINPAAQAKSSQWIVNKALHCILFISGTKIITKGLENVPKDETVLYVGNHRSYFDIVACYPLIKNNTGFIAKKEMAKIPFVRIWMRFMNCQFLDRDNIKEGLKTILTCIDLVKNGTSIFIFPEGTRSKTDEMLPFKEGSLKIAQKSGCAIVPVAITGTSAIFEDHIPWIKKKTIVIEFCPPVYATNLEKDHQKHLGQYVQNVIANALDVNKELSA